MTDEKINIVVNDGVSSSIATKLNDAATAAEKLDTSINKVKSSLSNFDAKGLLGIASAARQGQDSLTSFAKSTQQLGSSLNVLTKISQSGSQGITSLASSMSRITTVSSSAASGLRAYTSAAQAAGPAAATAARSVSSLNNAMQGSAASAAAAAAAQSGLASTYGAFTASASAATIAQTGLGNSSKVAAAGIAATSASATGLTSILQGLSLVAGGAVLLNSAETYATMAAKLNIVSKNSDEASAALNRLYDIARDTNSSVASSSDLYFKLALNSKELAKDQDRLAGIVEKVNKAALLTRPSAQQAASGILQFSQAMGKGALNGDELTSVLENIPGLGKAIADGLGITVSQLKELGAANKLTSTEVIRGIERSADQIDELFKKLPTTVTQATQILTDAFTRQIGIIDQTLGVTKLLATGIKALAAEMPTIIKQVIALGTAVGGLLVINLVTKGVLAFTAAIKANPIGAFITAIVYLITLAVQYRNELGLTNEKLTEIWNAMKPWLAGAAELFRFVAASANLLLTLLGDIASAISSAVVGAWNLLSKAATTAFRVISAGFSMVASVSTATWEVLTTAGRAVFNVLSTAVQAFGSLLSRVADFYVTKWTYIFTTVATLAITSWETIKGYVVGFYETSVQVATDLIKFWTDTWKKFQNLAKAAWEFVTQALENAAKTIQEKFNSILSGIQSFFNSITEWANQLIETLKEVLNLQSSAGSGTDGVETRAKGGPAQERKIYLTGEKGPELYRSSDGSREILLGGSGPQLFRPPKDGYVYNATDTARMMSNGALPRSLASSKENSEMAKKAIPRASGGPVKSDSGYTNTDTLTGRSYSYSPGDNVPKGFEDVMAPSGYYPLRNNLTGSLTLAQLPPYFTPDTVEAVSFQLNEATSFAKALNGEASKVMAKVAEEYAVTKVFGSPARFSEALMLIEGLAGRSGTGGLLAGLQGENGRYFTKSGDIPTWSFPDLQVSPKDIELVNKLKGTPREQLSQVVAAFKGVSTKEFTTADFIGKQMDMKEGGGLPKDDIPAFKNGGRFMVGGKSGIDQNVVQFRASRGEEVIVNRRPNEQTSDPGDSISTNTVINNYGVKDAEDAYGRNKGQIARDQERNIRKARGRR